MSGNFGDKIAFTRKQKDMTREELAERVGTSGAIIGRYERGDMSPSIEIATKIADALEVSLDYLTGKSSLVIKDVKMLQRLEDIDKLPATDKDNIFYTLDNLIKAAKFKTI